MGLREEVVSDFFTRLDADSRVPTSLSLALRDLLAREALNEETLSEAIVEALKVGNKSKRH